MSAQKSEKKKPDAFSGRLIDLFDEVYPSFLEEEIPESDMERLSAEKICEADWNNTAAEGIRKESSDELKAGHRTQRTGWKRIAVFSGFAAAGSAALTGLIVLACMRHSYGSAGAK